MERNENFMFFSRTKVNCTVENRAGVLLNYVDRSLNRGRKLLWTILAWSQLLGTVCRYIDIGAVSTVSAVRFHDNW